MDLRQLHYFVRVVELKSFTKAAEDLHVAQPALGVQVRKLEDELGQQLLNRHSRGIEPTEAGSLLVDRARTLLDAAARIRTELKQFNKQVSGQVRLGMAASISSLVAPRLISQCLAQFPDIHLVIVENVAATLVERLAGGQLDLILSYGVSEDRHIAAELIGEESLVFVTDRASAAGKPDTIAFAEVAASRLMLPRTLNGTLGTRLAHRATELGLILDVAIEVESEPLIRELVARDGGCTVLPLSAALRGVEDGHLAQRRIVDPEFPLKLWLASSAERAPSAATDAVRGIMLAVVRETAGQSGIWRLAE